MSIIAGFFVPHPPIIIPEIGNGEETKIVKTRRAYKDVVTQIKQLKPDTIILSSPHAKAYRDYVLVSDMEYLSGDLSMFGARDISFQVRVDIDLASAIIQMGKASGLPIGIDSSSSKELDHGTMVPLYFLQEELGNVPIVRLSTSLLPPKTQYDIGRQISQIIPRDMNVVWVASGDLSHKLKVTGPYGFVKEGPEFDHKFTTIIEHGKMIDFISMDMGLFEKAAVCGLGSMMMMAGSFDGVNTTNQLLSYEDTFGVGYAVASFYPKVESPYVSLAKQSLEYYLKTHKYLPISETIEKELREVQRGVFVSIHKQGKLRGCIGTIKPTTSCVAQEIIENAVSSGTHDYRFSPVQIQEIKDLEFSVDVLYPPEPITTIEDLDVKRYGVIVRKGYKTGLLLPNLEGVDDPEYQVHIALKKAGIHPDESYQMERFEVKRYK